MKIEVKSKLELFKIFKKVIYQLISEHGNSQNAESLEKGFFNELELFKKYGENDNELFNDIVLQMTDKTRNFYLKEMK